MNTETNAGTPAPPTTPPQPQVPAPPMPAPVLYGGIRRKSPGLALVLSFFPGLGHLYLGLYQRAIVVFGLFFLATVLAGQASDMGVIIAFIWFFAVIDAYRQAQIINSQEVEPSKPKRAAAAGSLGFGIFLIIVGIILLINNFHPIDLSWLSKWWPAILVIVGIYLIAAAYADRQKQLHASTEDEGTEDL